MNDTKEIGFQNKLESTVALVESIKGLIITTAQDFLGAKAKLETIRELEKELDAEYKAHPVIIDAKRLQGIKGDIATMLENARKSLKNGPMLDYERVQELKRIAEEKRIQAEMQRKADEEAAALAKIAAAAAAKAAKEAAALAEIERKKAEAARAEAARAKAKGDAEALRIAQEKQAAAKAEAVRIKSQAIADKAAADAEAERIKSEVVVVPTVVIEKTAPTVSRRANLKFSLRPEGGVKPEYLEPDMVKIGKVVRALGKAAEATVGGIEVYEELV